MDDCITFVGLDVSKRTVPVGVAPGDPREAVTYMGTIENTPEALRRSAKRRAGCPLSRAASSTEHVKPTNVRTAKKKHDGEKFRLTGDSQSGDRQIKGRVDHQDRGAGRCLGQSGALSPVAVTASRQYRRCTADLRPLFRRSTCRQGLRQQLDPCRIGRTGRLGRHSLQGRPGKPLPLGQSNVPVAPSGREFLR